jgi:DNA-binding CsgD family transcriptional regulator
MAGAGSARALLDVLEAADAASSTEQLPALVLPALRVAFDADSAGWTTLRGPPSRVPPRYQGHPGPLFDRASGPRVERLLAVFPLAVHTRPGGPGWAARRSDLQTRREYHACPVYTELLAPLGVEEILAAALRRPGAHVCLSLHRARRDFTPCTVRLLDQLCGLLERRARALPPPSGPAATLLTGRQGQVLALVGQGLTDAAIARRLGCSPRTVDKHLEHIYQRLGVHCRAQALYAALHPASRDPVSGDRCYSPDSHSQG